MCFICMAISVMRVWNSDSLASRPAMSTATDPKTEACRRREREGEKERERSESPGVAYQ